MPGVSGSGVLESMASPWMYAAFAVLVVALLALDLFVFHRKAHEVSLKEAAVWSVFWIVLALAFNSLIWLEWGEEKGLEFFTGYILEKSLSVDNLFVFLVIFSYFSVPAAFQHRVLFWGIIGALLMRALFIFAGVALIEAIDWVLYVFGIFLIFTGFRLLWSGKEEVRPEKNVALRIFRRLFPVTSEYHGEKFFVRESNRFLATPLMLVLVVVEATDVVFAVDSIPAIFAVTRDPFIVYTSNIFAILGLRALFFLLAGILGRLVYLRHGLGLILALIGVKMLVSDFYHIPVKASLAAVSSILAVTIVLSFLKTRKPLDLGRCAKDESPNLSQRRPPP